MWKVKRMKWKIPLPSQLIVVRVGVVRLEGHAQFSYSGTWCENNKTFSVVLVHVHERKVFRYKSCKADSLLQEREGSDELGIQAVSYQNAISWMT